jgi:hypothetical protein
MPADVCLSWEQFSARVGGVALMKQCCCTCASFHLPCCSFKLSLHSVETCPYQQVTTAANLQRFSTCAVFGLAATRFARLLLMRVHSSC